MDLLEHPRDIRDGHGNIIRVFSVGPGYFMVIKENIETREQLYWSDIYELGQPLKTNYYIIPMEEGFITSEFLADLVSDRLVTLELKGSGFWITRLHKENPRIKYELYDKNSEKELYSYEAVSFDKLSDSKPSYKALNSGPQALAYLKILRSIDLPNEEHSRIYWKLIEEKKIEGN